ncbi:hypothetical protein EMPS_01614 [Entomortierella parvispora]|uniref:Uncharacterized protein n=1 Tax=Entomortierella parvispora TaxID=205924 RepID=A0A9P3H3W2_9FUNG|nr:hypothetical protein EMPS_01614 [Entomortierella parvispora]
MISALRKYVSRDRIRGLRVSIYSFTSCNAFLVTASFSFSVTSFKESANAIYLIPQLCIFLCTVFYCFYKSKYSNPARPLVQLLLSIPLAAAYLFFSVAVFLKLAAGLTNVLFLFWIVEGVNVLIAVLILLEAWFTWLLRNVDEAQSTDDEDEAQQRQRSTSGQGSTDPTVPAAVHLYQPRLSLPHVNVAGSAQTADGGMRRHSVQASSTDGVVIQDDDDLYMEMEELPKYQRRRPAQSATIIDLSNLTSVDAAVLNTVIRDPEARLSLHGQAGPDAVHDIIITDPLEDDTTAPEYSPPLPPAAAPGSIPEVVIDLAPNEENQVSRDTTTETTAQSTTSMAAATIPVSQTTTESPTAPEPPVYVP